LAISSFPNLGMMTPNEIDEKSECWINEEMTEEELLQELMDEDREFFDNSTASS
jgi:hypothetical protein